MVAVACFLLVSQLFVSVVSSGGNQSRCPCCRGVASWTAPRSLPTPGAKCSPSLSLTMTQMQRRRTRTPAADAPRPSASQTVSEPRTRQRELLPPRFRQMRTAICRRHSKASGFDPLLWDTRVALEDRAEDLEEITVGYRASRSISCGIKLQGGHYKVARPASLHI